MVLPMWMPAFFKGIRRPWKVGGVLLLGSRVVCSVIWQSFCSYRAYSWWDLRGQAKHFWLKRLLLSAKRHFLTFPPPLWPRSTGESLRNLCVCFLKWWVQWRYEKKKNPTTNDMSAFFNTKYYTGQFWLKVSVVEIIIKASTRFLVSSKSLQNLASIESYNSLTANW